MKILKVLESLVLYPIFFLLLNMLGNTIPNWLLFTPKIFLYDQHQIRLGSFDIVLFLYGLVLFTRGMIALAQITKENHQAREKGATNPTRLLTEGKYESVRHPMYATFILLYVSLFIPTRSIYGLLICLVQCMLLYFNARYEDKKVLKPLFQKTYEQYCQQTKKLFFTISDKLFLVTGFAILAIGFFCN
ncbi:methyltransferase [uncultured Sphaerochaeta sp.]|uniref:methyltransferase family protein n=1 Tax=uncultured Sphaerochaeta sp. TaxID=886478 RepID=UPI002A0A30BD|nr:methyltransferase [uncultured Sphaerochaeta sp.]